MNYCVLGSGSKGNATYVEAGESSVLIDAGFSGKEIERRLAAIDRDMSNVGALLLTHEHSDHLKGAAVLARRYKIPLYATQAAFTAGRPFLGEIPCYKEFITGTSFNFAGISIHPFRISHDCADPVGFVLEHRSVSLGYCTDTGMVSRLMSHRLAGCHGLIFESNHDQDMLKNGPYPFRLKQRVSSNKGHLTNREAASFVSSLLHPDLKHITLAHLSQTNNDPFLAYDVFGEAIEQKRPSAVPCPGISLAYQDSPGELLNL